MQTHTPCVNIHYYHNAKHLVKISYELQEAKNNKEHIQSLLKHAHLNIGDIENVNVRNFLTEPNLDYSNPMMEFLDYMSKPENFWFTCKYLLNVDLLPFQLCILQELWNRKFPMLIASRGFGKSFMLSLYAVLRALILPNRKVVVVNTINSDIYNFFKKFETGTVRPTNNKPTH